MVASRNRGTEVLLHHIVRAAGRGAPAGELRVNQRREVEEEIDRLEDVIAGTAFAKSYPPRWLATKLIEEDEGLIEKVHSPELTREAGESLARLRSVYWDDAETLVVDARYGYISGLVREVLTRPAVQRVTISDWIDRFVLNRWIGIPLFLAILYGLFQFTFVLSPPMMDWIDEGLGWLGEIA
jgi:ferrous iron transport protein B